MSSALVWFRRDLRHFDHAALYHALRESSQVYCVFVFDRAILDALPDTRDRRIEFIHHSLVELSMALDQLSRETGGCGSGLIVRVGLAQEEIPRLARQLNVERVYANRDYEPDAIERDTRVEQTLNMSGIRFLHYKDQVIFDRDEVLTGAGRPFSVFTPYSRAWLRKLEPFHVKSYPVSRYAIKLAPLPVDEHLPSLGAIGFLPSNLQALRLPVGMAGGKKLFDDFCQRIESYRQARDFPAVKGVSYLSVHLRFGTVSIRELVKYASERGGAGAETWLNELIWREFYQMILWHHPGVVTKSFKPDYDRITWDDRPDFFQAWCDGKTGFPLVDAAMRQLNQTGYMHNRLRMVTASFLVKDLGIDWRMGEKYFARHLNDYDLAANNGGWQWAASTGCDAQPYFRIFNPVTQSERFDPKGQFIRRYIPELDRVPDRFIHAPWKMGHMDEVAAGVQIGQGYPAPIVDHALARQRTLLRFAVVKEVAEA